MQQIIWLPSGRHVLCNPYVDPHSGIISWRYALVPHFTDDPNNGPVALTAEEKGICVRACLEYEEVYPFHDIPIETGGVLVEGDRRHTKVREVEQIREVEV